MTIQKFIKLSKNFLTADKLLKITFASKFIGKLVSRKYELNLRRCGFIKHTDIEPLKMFYYSQKGAEEICRKYLQHQFNFLGTGWVCWNKNNAITKKKEKYEYIAWDKDVISSYQFTQRCFSSDLIPSLPKGIDIKRLWELGRMNHFPFMAMCAVNNDNLRATILEEFKYQVIDLILHNPIGIGVQYYCPMDVGIRCINLLFSYDILKQLDSEDVFSNEFSNMFENYILAQGKYIVQNLEYNFINKTSGNHFLCDISGLLWICAYFENRICATWYKSCKKLFFKEIEKQFLFGGSNYECSSGYHRLSCEIVVMGLVAIRWKEGNLSCSDSILKRLKGMAELSDLFRGCDGNMIQIGDMDSGFVLKMMPHYIGDNENTLSIDYVLGLMDGLKACQRTNEHNADYCVAQQILKGFAAWGIVATQEDIPVVEDVDTDLQAVDEFERFIATAQYMQQHECTLEYPGSVRNILSNSEFGLIKIIYEHADLYIRVIPDYRKMDLAHAHDDVFHYEIVYPTYRLYSDNGSINYTENVEIRNYYAGNQSHNTIIHKEPIVVRDGVFAASSRFQGDMCIKGKNIYLHVKGSFEHVRKFVFNISSVTIIDASDDYFEVNTKDNSYSFGYGQLLKS